MAMWAVVPVKSLLASKQRLSSLLSASGREQLATAMLLDVLASLSQTPAIAGIVLVSADAKTEQLVSAFDVSFLLEADDVKDLNAAIAQGVDYALAQGADEICVLHADLPLIDASIFDGFDKQHDVILFSDKSQTGTNGLWFSAKSIPPFHFGAMSQSRHLQAFAAADLPCQVYYNARLAFDIDEQDDVRLMLEQGLLHQQSNTARCLQALAENSWVKN